VVKTGFCKGDFSLTNEQQCHLKETLISELLEEVESIETSLKNMFFTPQQKCINISDFRLGAVLSAFGEHDVQSFTVARWTDFLPYIVNSRNGQ
jgi:hypothetical protein